MPHPDNPTPETTPGSPILIAYTALTLWGFLLGTAFGLLLAWLV